MKEQGWRAKGIQSFGGISPVGQQEHAPQTVVDASSEIRVLICISQAAHIKHSSAIKQK